MQLPPTISLLYRGNKKHYLSLHITVRGVASKTHDLPVPFAYLHEHATYKTCPHVERAAISSRQTHPSLQRLPVNYHYTNRPTYNNAQALNITLVPPARSPQQVHARRSELSIHSRPAIASLGLSDFKSCIDMHRLVPLSTHAKQRPTPVLSDREHH